MKIRFTLFLLFFSMLNSVFAQNDYPKTYLYFSSNGSGIKGKIISVPEEGKVKFAIDESIFKIVQKEKIILAFNEFGNYLLISSLSDEPAKANKQIEDFYNKSYNAISYDIIFKAVPFEVIPCTIIYNNDAINYKTLDNNSASINKDNVLAIILKDGGHEIVRDITEVAPILNTNSILFENTRQTKNSVKNTDNTKTKVVVPTEKKETASVNTEITSIDSGPKKEKPILDNDEKEAYKEISVERVQEFKDYLNIVSDKKRSSSEKSDAIQNALKLFTPGASIEVTSKNNSKSRKIPVETYLKNLSNLNYSSVNIEYANIKFVSDFTQADDGNYYGIISGEQAFMGYSSNGKATYTDVVNKNYKVKLESYQKFIDGTDQTKWKVLFGDVTVSQ
jgi:hypothetical protein